MSKININNLIKQSNFKSNIYLPIIEAIVNSIDAIDDENRKNTENGKIEITFEREPSLFNENSNNLSDFVNVTINDNGIGFNKDNSEAFDTLFTERKVTKGGKGFGRIMYKKYFQNIKIESVFFDDKANVLKKRSFVFGNNNIVDEDVIKDTSDTKTWSRLYLKSKKDGNFGKKLETVSKKILENLLLYFITESYNPPSIILKDEQSQQITLNDLYKANDYIKNIKTDNFELIDKDNKTETFSLHVFKIYSPQNQKSSINLVADKREVTSTNISEFIPEFEEDFLDPENNRNFIIKAYILSDYLDNNVDLERLSFRFGKRNTKLLFPFSQDDIEKKVSEIIELEFKNELISHQEKKKTKVDDFIQEHPWFIDYKDKIEWNKLPMNPSDDIIENHLHLIKYKSEKKTKAKINNILKNIDEDFETKINDVFDNLDKAKQSELAHYVSLRKVVLDIFKTILEKNINKKYSTERLIHNIIFPVKKYSNDITYYNEHNLWLLDERLSYTKYLASDKPIFNESRDRPDIVCFDKKVAFRGDNEASNPITIFEFKRPGRDDFANLSSKEDPYEQITRYIEKIKEGSLKTVNDRPISIGDNTPFYGYIIADLTGKVKDWLIRKDFDPTPDGEGYFKYHKAYNLHTEFISWDKLLKDAQMRNKIFFSKLGF